MVFLTFLEAVGLASFAISGAMVAIEKELDIFGVLLLGVTTAVGGGAIRDVLLGIHPPAMFIHSWYVAVAVAFALAVFLFAYAKHDLWNRYTSRLNNINNFFDAVGLGLFVTGGINTAFGAGYGDKAFLCIFVGVLSGVGGGLLRDVMVGKVPMILRRRIYAVAAIVGGLLYYVLLSFGLPALPCMTLAAAVVVALRILATHYQWNLPRVIRKE